MKKATPKTAGGKRPGAGRPATGRDPSRTFRLSDGFIAGLDAWAEKQDDRPTRSEAIRRLVEMGLAGAEKPAARRSEISAAKAKELAAKAIDRLVDHAAHPDEQASRKRRLLKGPEEFREVRLDLPKKT